MTLSKGIRAQEGVPTSQTGSPATNTAWIGQNNTQPKSPPKRAHSALPGNPTAVTSVTNHSSCLTWPWINLLELRRGFLHHKVFPRPQIRPEFAKTTLRQNHLQNSTFRSVRGSNGCYMGNQPLYFDEMTLSKPIRAQDGGSYITRWHPAELERSAKISPKIARSALSGHTTAVTSVIR